jgi:ABC-type glycerol-3-phosphate transport system substrate-binding protein
MLKKLLAMIYGRFRQPPLCDLVDEKLEAYLDKALPPAEAWVITTHLQECAHCRALVQTETRRMKQFRGVGGPRRVLPRSVSAEIRHNVYRRVSWRLFMQRTKRNIQAVVSTLILILLTAGVFWWWQGNNLDSLVPINPPIPEQTEATLTMAGFPAFQQAYETLAQQFQEQHPTLAVQYIALDQQASSLRQQVELADVVLINGRPPADAAALLLDLAPLAEASEPLDTNAFWPGLLDACQRSGVQVGLPLSANVDLIYYDKAALAAAGLPAPEPDWDWLTFRQIVTALAPPAENGRYAFVDSGRPLSLLGPLVDGLLLANDNALDAERLAAELEWYVSFVREGVIPTPAGDPQTAVAQRDNLIRNRQAALWLGGQFELGQWQAIYGDNLGVVPFPGQQPSGSNPARPTCAAISAGTNQAQAAWTWLHFLSQQPPVGWSGAPARLVVAQSSGYWAELDDETAVALHHALERGWYGSDAVAEMRAINDALIQAVAGEATLAQSLPTTIEPQPTAPPPTPDSTPVAIATPRLTPTPAALPGSSIPTDNVIVVDYYAYETSHSSRAALEALARAFNEAQDSIEVRLGTAFGGTYITDVADNYDCFAWGGWASSYATTYPDFTAKFYSLTALMAGEDAAFAEDFSPDQVAWSRFEGELYALPVAVQPQVIQYNADLLASLGVDPPSPDWTVDEFWDVAIAATRSEGGQRIYGFLPAILMPANLPLLFPEEAYPFDGYSSPPVGNFTDPAVIQGLTWLANMVENRVMFPIDRGGTRTADNPRYDSLQIQEQSGYIVREEAAMWVASAGQGDYHFATGAVPFPQTSLLLLPTMTPSLTALYISRRANNPLGCWEWLKFLSAQPDIFPGIPVRHSVMESSGWVDAVGPETAAAYRVALSQPIQPVPDQDDPYLEIFYPHYRRWWSDALHEVFAGGSPTDVLTEMQRRADVYLTCIMAAPTLNQEQRTTCIQQADPGFRQ